MSRKSKYRLELEERRRNPGGYIGEAMQDIKPPRKPRPFSVRGCIVGKCVVGLESGERRTLVYDHAPTPRDARRLAKWLTEAAEWKEAGK